MDIPGAFPSSEPPTPDVYPQQQQQYPHQYQQPQDARVPTSVQEGRLGHAGTSAGSLEQRSSDAQRQVHRYDEPLSRAIPAVEGGEVQSHRDDTFQTHGHQASGQVGQTSQTQVHRYEQPRSSAIPAVIAAEVQSHRDDSTLGTGGTHQSAHSAGPLGQERHGRDNEQPRVHRYEEPASRATQAMLSGEVQAHRDNAATSEPRQPESQIQSQPIISDQTRQAIVEGSQNAAQQATDAAIAAKDNLVATAYSAGQTATNTTALAASYLPESVQQVLPASVQEAMPAPSSHSTSTNQVKAPEVSPLVPTEVKGSIQRSGQPAEAAANTDAVLHKNVVETELLKEVKEAGSSRHPQQHFHAQSRGEEWPLRDENNEHTERRGHEQLGHQEKDTPYQASLPTAAQGGIYNSVIGHGSARDDHDHRQSLPERSRHQGDEYSSSQVQSQSQSPAQSPSSLQSNRRSLVSGGVAGTGVYNTIIGHGSQDEHARQHASPPTGQSSMKSSASSAPVATDGINTNTVPTQSSGTGHHGNDHEHTNRQALSGAPRDSSQSVSLPGEARYDTEDSHTARNLAAGAGVGAAAVAGTRALQDRHTSSDDTGRQTSPQHDRHVAYGAAANQSGDRSIGHAVPLAQSIQSDAGTQRAFPLTSASIEGSSSETKRSSNLDLKDREGFAAGAAASTGIGAYDYSQKHKFAEQQATHSPVTHTPQQSTTSRSPQSADRHGFLQHHHQQQQPHDHTFQKSPSPDAKASRSRSSSQSDKQRHGLLGMISRKDEGASSHPKIAEDEKGHRVLAKDPPADIAPAVIAARQASVRHQRHSPERGLEDSRGTAVTADVPHTRNDQSRQRDDFTKPESDTRRDGMATSRDLPHNTNSSRQFQSADFDRSAAAGIGASGPLHGAEEASTAQHRHNQPTSTVAGEHLPPHFSNNHNTVTGDKLPYNTLASGTPSGVALGPQSHQTQTQSPQPRGDPNITQTSAAGVPDRHSESHVGRDVALGAGVGAAAVAGSRATRGPEQDRDVSQHNRSNDDGMTGTHPTTTSNDFYSGNRSENYDSNPANSGDHSATEREDRHAPHSSRVANALDPRVDSDRDGSRTLKVFRSHRSDPTNPESSGHETFNGQDRSRNMTGPSTSGAHQNDELGSHEVRNSALGAGAGGAAAYASSRAIHDYQPTDTHNTASSFGDPTFTRPAQAAGEPDLGTSGGFAPRQDTGLREAADPAARHRDGYDHLASGTPSGIATSSTSPHGQEHPRSSFSTQAQHANSHEYRKSDIAAGVGAGAAAYTGTRAVEDHRHPFSTPTDSSSARQTPPGLAGEDASLYTAGTTTNRTISNSRTGSAGGSDGYDHLASGTPSGVEHTRTADRDDVRFHGTKAAPVSREAYGAEGITSGTSSRAYTDQDWATPNTSGGGIGGGLAAGAAGALYTGKSEVHDARHSASTAQPATQGSRTTEPPLYNILPSGTPSGVNIEYKRRSKELSRE